MKRSIRFFSFWIAGPVVAAFFGLQVLNLAGYLRSLNFTQ